MILYYDFRAFKAALFDWIKLIEDRQNDPETLFAFAQWFSDAPEAKHFAGRDELLKHLRRLIVAKNYDRARKLVASIPGKSLRLWVWVILLVAKYAARLAVLCGFILIVLWLVGVWP